MMKILNVPNPILTSQVQSVTIFDSKLKNIINEMDKILVAQQDPQGVGLAAPQVGLNLRLFIIKPTPKAKTEEFINPKIVKRRKNPTSPAKRGSRGKQPLEGCLSIPRIWGAVKRSTKILLEYQTADGSKQTIWFSGFKAVIIQHEMDHLNGVLFTQRVLEQNKPLYEEKDGKLEKILVEES